MKILLRLAFGGMVWGVIAGIAAGIIVAIIEGIVGVPYRISFIMGSVIVNAIAETFVGILTTCIIASIFAGISVSNCRYCPGKICEYYCWYYCAHNCVSFSGIIFWHNCENCCEYLYGYFACIIGGIIVGNIVGIICR